jgi:hypothetical protein
MFHSQNDSSWKSNAVYSQLSMPIKGKRYINITHILWFALSTYHELLKPTTAFTMLILTNNP